MVSRRAFLKGALLAGAAATAVPGEAKARAKVEPSPEAVGMLFDSTRCVGCRGCMVACKEANDSPWEKPPEKLSNEAKTVIQKRKVSPPGGEARTVTIKRQCMQCVDPSCVSACMLGAMHKEGEGKRDMGGEKKGTGIVVYDPSLCLGCRYCQIACAFAVPTFEWKKAFGRIVKCELCRKRAVQGASGPTAVANPACAQVCPSEALIYGYRADLLKEARRRLAEDPQGYNPRIYGESDAGGTQVLYLAAADVQFKDLGLPSVAESSPASFSENVSHAPYLHGITPFALYAAAAFVINRNHKKHDAHQASGSAAHGTDSKKESK